MEENLQQGHDQRQRRLRTADNVVSHPPEQPQRCPRCDSVNTKFCYYNNYSLTQPRYFCKTCRRYWTQGGTLRNVPVGGGCRKGGKRSKPSSSGGENSRSQPSPPLPPSRQPPLQLNPNLPTGNLSLRNTEIGDLGLNPTITTTNSLFADGGFLSNSFGSFHQALNLGSQFAGTPSNLSLLHGFNVHNLRPQSIQSQNEIQQMGHREKITEPFYPSDQTIIHHQNRPTSSWTQTFINSTTTPTAVASSSSFWNNTSNAAGPSVGPTNQWPDLTGFGPPP